MVLRTYLLIDGSANRYLFIAVLLINILGDSLSCLACLDWSTDKRRLRPPRLAMCHEPETGSTSVFLRPIGPSPKMAETRVGVE